MIVKHSDLEPSMTKDTMLADASDLNWIPGSWPKQIKVVDADGFETFLFHRSGDDILHRYSTMDGSFKVVIFND